MSHKWKGLLSLVCLALVLMLAPAALAAVEATAPEESRIQVQAPAGLSYTHSYDETLNMLTVSIKANQTTWSAVENAASLTAESGIVPFEIGLTKASGAAKARWAVYSGPFNTTDEFYHTQVLSNPSDSAVSMGAVRPNEGSGDVMLGAFPIASYFNTDTVDSIMPMTYGSQDCFVLVCLWQDAAGNEVGFEKLYVSVEWSDTSTINLDTSKTGKIFAPIPEDRLTFKVTEGIVFAENGDWKYDPNSGVISAVVDSEKTKWALVAANSSDPEKITLFNVDVSMPDDDQIQSAYYMGYNYSRLDEVYSWHQMGSLQDLSHYPPLKNMGIQPLTLQIGTYDENTQMFFPQEATLYGAHKHVFHWGNANNVSLGGPFEIISYNVTFTDPSPVTVVLDKVPADNIIPDYNNEGLSATKANGSVAYVNEESPVAAANYVTAILAPAEGANWTAWIGGNAKEMVTGNGLARPAVLLKDELGTTDQIVDETVSIVWKDADGKVQKMETLDLTISHGQPKFWPTYIDWLKPFDASSVKVTTTGGINGTQTTYDTATGMVHLAIDSEKVIAEAQTKELTDAKVNAEIVITPPANAVSYTSGGAILGDEIAYGYNVAQRHEQSLLQSSASDRITIQGGSVDCSSSIAYFNKISYELADGTAASYYESDAGELAGVYGAQVFIYRWYDKNGELIGGNYIAYQHDEVSLITTTEVLSSADELDENDDSKNGKKKPLIIVDGKGQGLGQGKLSLRAERSPSSPNTHHYELCLVNDASAEVEFSGSGIVYVPYPDGYNETNCGNLEITIGHYNSDGSKIVEVFSTNATDERLKIKPTAHGLCFTVSSLSPFVVSWEDTTPVEINPLIAVEQMSWGNDSIPGLKATKNFANGKYHFVINSETSEWGAVSAYYGGSQFMELKEQIAPPHSAAKYFVATQFDKPLSQLTDAEIEAGIDNELKFLDAGPQDLYNIFYNGYIPLGMDYATYLKAQQAVCPNETTYAWAVRWYDANKNVLGTQKMDVVIDFTDSGTQHVDPAIVPENRIIFSTDASVLSAAYEKDGVVYTIQPRSYPYLTTGVKAPSTAAVRCEVSGIDTDPSLITPDTYTFADGVVRLTLNSGYRHLALMWYDSADDLILCESLAISVVEKDAEPWPAYVEGWVPAKITNVVVNGAQGVLDEPVLKADIADAEILYQYRNDYASKANLDEATVVYTIEAPETVKNKAVRVAVMLEASECIHSYQVSSSVQWWKENYMDYGDFYTLSNGRFNLTDGVFTEAYSDQEIIIYKPLLNIENDFGWVAGLFWLDANDKILATSWLTIQSDDFLSVGKSKPVKSEKEITAPVKTATYVDTANTDWVLVSQYHPQYGEKAYHVQLHLEDGDGWIRQPGKNTVFFLPYPDGHEFNGPYTYKVKHYTADHKNFKWVDVAATEKGLRVELDDLSPFVVSWEEAVVEPEPETLNVWMLSFSLDEVPGDLEMKSVEDVKTALRLNLLAQYSNAQPMQYFAIERKISTDEGKSWSDAPKDTWPTEGTVEYEIPFSALGEGVNGDTYDFVAVSLAASTHYGEKLGMVNKLSIVETASGVRVTVKAPAAFVLGYADTSLAPVDPSTPTTSTEPETIPDVPKTGDNTPLIALFALLIASLMGCVVMGKRRANQR